MSAAVHLAGPSRGHCARVEWLEGRRRPDEWLGSGPTRLASGRLVSSPSPSSWPPLAGRWLRAKRPSFALRKAQKWRQPPLGSRRERRLASRLREQSSAFQSAGGNHMFGPRNGPLRIVLSSKLDPPTANLFWASSLSSSPTLFDAISRQHCFSINFQLTRIRSKQYNLSDSLASIRSRGVLRQKRSNYSVNNTPNQIQSNDKNQTNR